MGLSLQITMLIISLLALVFVVNNIRKEHMDASYAVSWIVFCLFLVLLSIFPSIIDSLANLLNIANPVFALFVFVIAYIFILIFFTNLQNSKHKREIKNLTYEIARLEKEIRDLKNK